jgi:ligand-binding SRPBCC domain-containing protein
MLHRLHRRQHLPTSVEAAWRFFSDPKNLRAITPPWLDLTITSEVPDVIHPGLIITYTHRPVLGLARPWVTEITHVAPPGFFVDEQRLGPFRFWHHAHAFRPVPGGVEMEDRIHYAPPLGPIGEAVHALAVRGRLEAIFRFRAEALKRLFPDHPPT